MDAAVATAENLLLFCQGWQSWYTHGIEKNSHTCTAFRSSRAHAGQDGKEVKSVIQALSQRVAKRCKLYYSGGCLRAHPTAGRARARRASLARGLGVATAGWALPTLPWRAALETRAQSRATLLLACRFTVAWTNSRCASAQLPMQSRLPQHSQASLHTHHHSHYSPPPRRRSALR